MNNLTFKNCVLKEFDFLITKYGLNLVQASPCYLRFESETVFAEIYYDDQRSFELDFSLGLLDDLYEGNESPFYLGEMIRFSMTGAEYRLLQASTPEKVTHLVPKLANLTENYAKEFLSGNRLCFKALSDFRNKECNEYALDTRLKNVRAAAQKAWQEKDYVSVIKLYEPIKMHITQSELKKLEYCHKLGIKNQSTIKGNH